MANMIPLSDIAVHDLHRSLSSIEFLYGDYTDLIGIDGWVYANLCGKARILKDENGLLIPYPSKNFLWEYLRFFDDCVKRVDRIKGTCESFTSIYSPKTGEVIYVDGKAYSAYKKNQAIHPDELFEDESFEDGFPKKSKAYAIMKDLWEKHQDMNIYHSPDMKILIHEEGGKPIK